MKKLLLFDIDGTILLTHGVGRRSLEAALGRVFDRPISTEGIRFSGKTDPQIIREVLEHAGFAGDRLNGRFEEALTAYAEAMRAALDPARVTLLPGVRPLVEHLHADPSVALGLVTGNLQEMAYLKLRAVGLADYFPFGAFGSDSPERADLPAIAVERARARTGRTFTGKDVVIIGDTEHDIRCGRGIDAYSVGVCTGHYRREDLAPHSPDILLDDLADREAFLRIVRSS